MEMMKYFYMEWLSDIGIILINFSTHSYWTSRVSAQCLMLQNSIRIDKRPQTLQIFSESTDSLISIFIIGYIIIFQVYLVIFSNYFITKLSTQYSIFYAITIESVFKFNSEIK